MDKKLKLYHLADNLIGLFIGIIACMVYILTAEATASWWDCGEYIATANTLQVGHPPGAPTFQLIGRLFSMMTSSEYAAFAVNCMSAICSGLGIMFLYWTITMLAKKMVNPEDLSLKNSKVWAVFASGVVGALAYTFTDTYWFSAVEGEVYAMSSFFTAVVFWAILKWEEQADDKYALRWLILICFLVGLAIGVHLLNLLTIPAIVYVVYFKKWKKTGILGFLLSGAISVVLLAIVLWIIIPGIVNLSSDFDVFFVNKLHFGFNFGTFFYFILISVFVLWGLLNNHLWNWMNKPGRKSIFLIVNIAILAVICLTFTIVKMGSGNFSFGFIFVLLAMIGVGIVIILGKNRPVVNASILGMVMLIIGYSTFFVLIIRANTNTPLNENAPKDAVAMRAYLGREQYGQTPFLYGAYYTAGNPNGVETGYAKYIRSKDAKGRDYYKVASYEQKYKYKKNHMGVLPRMWSPDNSRKHPLYYEYWAGRPLAGEKPSAMQNSVFFHRYQLNWMYWRYFMWNFAGRQNDIQGHHFNDNVTQAGAHYATIDYLNGNWISGIKFVDAKRLGPQDNLPVDLAQNKARNKYYMLPLLLGLIGLLYHCVRRPKDAFVTFIMFFMTGLAIAIYLNMPPMQPRERDYAFVGSFYFFCIWIGLGLYAIYDWSTRKVKFKELMPLLIGSGALLVVGGLATLLFGGAWFVLVMMGGVGLIVCLCNLIVNMLKLPKGIVLPLMFIVCMGVPAILCAENWDDHDRSQKTAARDFAKNYLGLADENGVVITFGDNDTFPLWYVQEVEHYRTDVRILNYTLSGMHWYVEQLYNTLYESEALSFTLPKDMYGLGHEVFQFNPNGKRMEVTEALEKVRNDRKKYVQAERNADSVVLIPTNKFKITLNKPVLVEKGVITAEEAEAIPDVINFDLNVPRGYLMRQEMMMLDFLGTNRFERSVFIMNPGYIENIFPVVNEYSVNDGMLYKLVPYPVQTRRQFVYTDRTADYFLNGAVNADGTRDTLLWGNLNKNIYIDPISENMGQVQRQTFVLVASQKLEEGDTLAAKKLVAMAEKYFPSTRFYNDRFAINMVLIYANLGDQVNAYRVWCDIVDYYSKHNAYLDQFKGEKGQNVSPMKQLNDYFLSELAGLRQSFTGRPESVLTDEGEKAFQAADQANIQRLATADAAVTKVLSRMQ
ncbi:MAG: DUF2723 domain-containing protein [Bacteroidales bacterium]|nr:DUF2723 domain-containing protein [Bacteroidales bacterium]